MNRLKQRTEGQHPQPTAPATASVDSPLLDASHLSVGYRNRRHTTTTLANVNLRVERGDLIAVVGGNGTGKSTLLRSLTGVQPPLNGTVSLHGQSIAAMNRRQRARHVALVLADRLDTVNLTVTELVALGRHPHTGTTGQLDDHDRAIVARAMSATGVAHHANRPINQLSDGERQRVAIARAVAQQPDLLVLDEPTAFLDPRARQTILALLESLTASRQFAAIIATHDLELVLPRATHIWVTGSGRLSNGTLHDPQTLRALNNELGATVTTIDGTRHIIYETPTQTPPNLEPPRPSPPTPSPPTP